MTKKQKADEDNDGVLAGMACPKCSSKGPFKIDVLRTVTVFDSGDTDDQGGDTEWEDTSACACDACDFQGKVADFSDPFRKFAVKAARLYKDGEKDDSRDDPFVLENDDALDDLHELINEARALTGINPGYETEDD